MSSAPSAETDAIRAVIAQTFDDHAPADTRGMAGHARPHFWGCICRTYGHGQNGHREHLIGALATAAERLYRPEEPGHG